MNPLSNTSVDNERRNEVDINKVEGKPVMISFSELQRRNQLPLFAEAIAAALTAAAIYMLPDFRRLAMKGLLSDEDAKEVLELPMTVPTIRTLVDKHMDKIVKRSKHSDFFLKADDYLTKQELPGSFEVVFVGDEHSDKEFVHFVGHDRLRKVIVLTFRGSVTLQDWSQDSKIMMSRDFSNPLYGVDGQPETLGVHSGFRDYLCGRCSLSLGGFVSRLAKKGASSITSSKSKKSEEREETLTRMETIVEELRKIKEQYPEYPIYITGHSLGGALALLAALVIACDPVLSALPEKSAAAGLTPVTCIVVANPKVGDKTFTNAIYHLEKMKKLRCLCIHNALDVVPRAPFNVQGLDSGYWHAGYRLVLYDDAFEIGRSQSSGPSLRMTLPRGCFPSSKNSELTKWKAPGLGLRVRGIFRNNHNYRLYMKTLSKLKDALSDIHLSDLYKNIWQESEPVKMTVE